MESSARSAGIDLGEMSEMPESEELPEDKEHKPEVKTTMCLKIKKDRYGKEITQ